MPGDGPRQRGPLRAATGAEPTCKPGAARAVVAAACPAPGAGHSRRGERAQVAAAPSPPPCVCPRTPWESPGAITSFTMTFITYVGKHHTPPPGRGGKPPSFLAASGIVSPRPAPRHRSGSGGRSAHRFSPLSLCALLAHARARTHTHTRRRCFAEMLFPDAGGGRQSRGEPSPRERTR